MSLDLYPRIQPAQTIGDCGWMKIGSPAVKYLSNFHHQKVSCLIVTTLGLKLYTTPRHYTGREHVAVKLLLQNEIYDIILLKRLNFFTRALNPSTLNASSVYSSSSLSSMASTLKVWQELMYQSRSNGGNGLVIRGNSISHAHNENGSLIIILS